MYALFESLLALISLVLFFIAAYLLETSIEGSDAHTTGYVIFGLSMLCVVGSYIFKGLDD